MHLPHLLIFPHLIISSHTSHSCTRPRSPHALSRSPSLSLSYHLIPHLSAHLMLLSLVSFTTHFRHFPSFYIPFPIPFPFHLPHARTHVLIPASTHHPLAFCTYTRTCCYYIAFSGLFL
ncbi:hypothetical protein C8F04DRAFT_1071285 [Mycena alexandri]|uniref:Uncharacterized protein n=1 Tax=Mycena alexandri TaxID=1745969 RepID=A0AAD6TES6_9AGAR|nr:hypothetical protein C8F04DRAFT_1071285 [Mycena alexandri]